jgi:hypothetical protein
MRRSSRAVAALAAAAAALPPAPAPTAAPTAQPDPTYGYWDFEAFSRASTYGGFSSSLKGNAELASLSPESSLFSSRGRELARLDASAPDVGIASRRR